MEQEDYLKRQIDQLGRVLGKILADLTGLQARGRMGEGIEAANQALKAELTLDIDGLTSIPAENFITTLLEGRKMNTDSLNTLAEILIILAEGSGNSKKSNEKNKLYGLALTIYEYLEVSSSTYSFDRHVKIEKLKTQSSKLKS